MVEKRNIIINAPFAKIFDLLIYNNIACMLQKNIIFQQHGSMPGISAILNLAEYTEFILDGRCHTNFDKAFDCVNHKLCHKINLYSI